MTIERKSYFSSSEDPLVLNLYRQYVTMECKRQGKKFCDNPQFVR